ncbi:alcohol dehydrogenase catalytic domain-containing protein, partial [Candidatus Peregrinibacteria bacterium]|nr:alcohol dehydrogenase catalytic domain-containing protein [Candidatus Peregrinibacteria bacterium]
VRIKIEYATICHTDFFVIDGHYPNTKYPTVPGHEFSGVIDECGKGVKFLSPGDKVTAMAFEFCGVCRYCLQGKFSTCENIKGLPFDIEGCFQEFLIINESSCFRIPEEVTLKEAAVVEAIANGCAAFERANIEEGETVLIIGPGPIGLFTLQWVKLKNPKVVILTGTRNERLQKGQTLGADFTINVKENEFYKGVMELTDGKGVDVIIFCGGGDKTFLQAQNLLTKYGRLVIEAVPGRSDELWDIKSFDFTAKAVSILGTCGYTGIQFKKTLDMLALKKIDVDSIITHTFSLEEFAEAFEYSKKRIDSALKVQFKIG